MDPAGAFAIAAGVLQTVHLSFEAVAKCRELYRDGSLAEDKSTKEFTQYLGKFYKSRFLVYLHFFINLKY